MKQMLITGASSGIGLALAGLAAKSGYSVIACARNQAALTKLAQTDNISTLVFDVCDKSTTKQVLGKLQPDICVLNAGVCEYVDIDLFKSDMFERVFAVNFFGVIHCLEALLPNLREGHQLVLVDSLARLLPFTRSQAYGASKAALHYLCKSLEVDLATRGVRVQCVSPGFVKTPLTDKNDFAMPMRISAEQAAKYMLKGIEQGHSSIFFPRLFSLILRFCSHLPGHLKVALSKSMANAAAKEAH